MIDPIEQFRAAISAAGITPPKVISPDGKLHRFASNGDRRDDAGWYVLHADGLPAGRFGCFRSGVDEPWRADIGRKLTPQEIAEHWARVEAIQRKREAEDAKRKAQARRKTAEIWNAAEPAPADHPYLTRKGIKPHGARVQKGFLTVPLYDGDELYNLQFIGADGGKRSLKGGRVDGCCYIFGKPTGTLCLAEGFATAASIHECTGHPVAIAFGSGNLPPVARSLWAKFPDVRLIVCSDIDLKPTSNGMAKAREAAEAVGAELAIPGFGPDRPEWAKDFNDLHQCKGSEAVRTSIESAFQLEKPNGYARPNTLENVPAGKCSYTDSPISNGHANNPHPKIDLDQFDAAIEPGRAGDGPKSNRRPSEVSIIFANKITPEPIEWLWVNSIAKRKLQLIAGAPGAGKSTIAFSLAATISSGGYWPDKTKASIGTVLIWSSEDSPGDTIVPRLMQMGADLNHIGFVRNTFTAPDRHRPFNPAVDMPALVEKVKQLGGVDLLILVVQI